ncbi:hypothetical protein [Plantactinospora sp. B5E13]|uniref:hypothetical protein n=1 Tax=unclassified Plantactinospora TaxID=2631981 RepID=UPI00325E4B6F
MTRPAVSVARRGSRTRSSLHRQGHRQCRGGRDGRPGGQLWSTDRDGTYAEELALVGTDPRPHRQRTVVAAYRERIAAGVRPAVVALFTTPESLVGYLLDGHHKMVAGAEAGVVPRVLAVTPERPVRPDNAGLRRAVPAVVATVAGHHRHPTTTVLDHLRRLSR